MTSISTSTTAIRTVFLANDVVYEQVIAFLESFRTCNPSMKLSMIPFADDIDKLSRLTGVYDFDILNENLARWDSLADEIFPGAQIKHRNRLRKLSIFDATADATIYIDIDTVVLKNFDFLRTPIVSGDVDFICTAAGNDPWVYNEKYKNYARLRQSKRFSDGFFVFNPHKINVDLAYKTLINNKEVYLDVRAEQVYSQPITNFIVDMLELKLREVYSIFPDISPQVWYAGEALSLGDGVVKAADGRDVLFVHWAGPVDMSDNFRFKDLYETYVSRAKKRAFGAIGRGLEK